MLKATSVSCTVNNVTVYIWYQCFVNNLLFKNTTNYQPGALIILPCYRNKNYTLCTYKNINNFVFSSFLIFSIFHCAIFFYFGIKKYIFHATINLGWSGWITSIYHSYPIHANWSTIKTMKYSLVA